MHVHVPHLPPRAVAVACTTLCMLLCPPRNFSQCNSCLFCELLSLQRDHAHTERQSDRPTLAGARSRSAVHKPGKPGAICHMVTPISVHDSSNGGAAGGAGMLNVTQAAAGPVATGPAAGLESAGQQEVLLPARHSQTSGKSNEACKFTLCVGGANQAAALVKSELPSQLLRYAPLGIKSNRRELQEHLFTACDRYSRHHAALRRPPWTLAVRGCGRPRRLPLLAPVWR